MTFVRYIGKIITIKGIKKRISMTSHPYHSAREVAMDRLGI